MSQQHLFISHPVPGEQFKAVIAEDVILLHKNSCTNGASVISNLFQCSVSVEFFKKEKLFVYSNIDTRQSNSKISNFILCMKYIKPSSFMAD